MWNRKAIAYIALGIALLAVGMKFDAAFSFQLGAALTFLLLAAWSTERFVKVDLKVDQSARRAFEGDPIQVKLTAATAERRPRIATVRTRLSPSIEVTNGAPSFIAELKAERPVEHQFEFTTRAPGQYHLEEAEIEPATTFGLVRQRRRKAGAATLVAYPRGEELVSSYARSLRPKASLGPHPVRLPGIGMNFYALRQYTPHDEMRMINWKASARAGELIVSEHERESMGEATLLVDAREVTRLGTVSHNASVLCRRAAASLLEALLNDRNTVRLLLYGSHQPVHLHPGTGERHLHQCLEALAVQPPRGTIPIGDAVAQLLPHLRPRSPLFVVTSAIDDATVPDAVARLQAQGSTVIVVAPSISSLLERLRKARAPPEPNASKVALDERASLVRALRSLGTPLIEWDGEERLENAIEAGVLT